jgi:hypothetical protein
MARARCPATAIGGGFVGAWWQERGQRRIQGDQRRERAAVVLAEVTALFEDSSPYLVHESDDPTGTLAALFERREKVRMPLLMLATGHPSARVCQLAGTVDYQLATNLRAMTLALQTAGGDDPPSGDWEMARGFHGTFQKALAS